MSSLREPPVPDAPEWRRQQRHSALQQTPILVVPAVDDGDTSAPSTPSTPSTPARTVHPLKIDMCMYHGNCMDGACAAALVRRVLDAHGHPCVFVPCWWETVDMVAIVGKTVLFVDITPSITLLGSVCAAAKDVFVIDHHASAAETLHALLHRTQFIFNEAECGSTLTWMWLQSHMPEVCNADTVPPLLPYIKALDLFDWRELMAAGDHDSMRVCRALEVGTEPSVTNMQLILDGGHEYLATLRRNLAVIDPIIEYQITRCVSAAEVHALVHMPYVRVAVVNAQTFINFLAHRLYSTTSVHVAWIWYYHGPTRRVRVMLRSSGRFDCNAYARAYHGGGHPNSASFVCSDERSMRNHLVTITTNRGGCM
jgi:hypothetical protein